MFNALQIQRGLLLGRINWLKIRVLSESLNILGHFAFPVSRRCGSLMSVRLQPAGTGLQEEV